MKKEKNKIVHMHIQSSYCQCFVCLCTPVLKGNVPTRKTNVVAMAAATSAAAIRAVKLKISWEEWDSCFHFSFLEVLDVVKDVWQVEILNLDTKCFFVNVLLYNISS